MNLKFLALIISLITLGSASAESLIRDVISAKKHNEIIRVLNSSKDHQELKKKIIKNSDRSSKNLNEIKANFVISEMNKREAAAKDLRTKLKMSKAMNLKLADNYRRKVGRLDKGLQAFSGWLMTGAGLLLLGVLVVIRRHQKHASLAIGSYEAKSEKLKKIFKEKNPLFKSLRVAAKINSNINYVVYDREGQICFYTDGIEALFEGNFNPRSLWASQEISNFELKKIGHKNVRVTRSRVDSYFLFSKKTLSQSDLRVCQVLEVPLVQSRQPSTIDWSRDLAVIDIVEDVFAEMSSFKPSSFIDRIQINQVGNITSLHEEEVLRNIASTTFKSIDILDESRKSNYDVLITKVNERIAISITCEGRLLNSESRSNELERINSELSRIKRISNIDGNFIVKNMRNNGNISFKILIEFDSNTKDSLMDQNFRMEFNTMERNELS